MESELTRFEVVLDDITKFPADVIVNAANVTLLGGGGVDGAIHRAAGPRLLAYCATLGGCLTGNAKITPAFGIKTANYIVHTPGPRFSAKKADLCDALLTSCYRNSLKLAEEKGARTIAFPSISTGVYAFPLERAALVAAKALYAYRADGGRLETITMVCFDDATKRAYEGSFKALQLM